MCLYCIQQSNNFRVNNPYIEHKYIKMCLNGKQNKNKSAVTGTNVILYALKVNILIQKWQDMCLIGNDPDKCLFCLFECYSSLLCIIKFKSE